jgi:type II secretory pathway pseudopilin PulG
MHVRAQAGFTYLMLLWWVAVSSVLVTALSQTWVIDARREREFDLVFKGEQIRSAIAAYAKAPVAEGTSRLPSRLEDLLQDQRLGKPVHHLRRLWRDPITGGEWGLIKAKDGGITGVFSTSPKAPLRPPENVSAYVEWRFVGAAEVAASAAQAASGPASSRKAVLQP